MEVSETAKSYYIAIGEFVTVYAGIELHLSKLITTKKQTPTVTGYGISIEIAANFDVIKKANKVDHYIKAEMPLATDDFKKEWAEIYKELIEITEARHFLVHGLCMGFVYYEPIDTFLTDKGKNMKVRKFYLQEIIDLIKRARAVLGLLQSDFWHKYAKLLGFTDFYMTGLNLGEIPGGLQRPVNDA